MNDLLNQVLNYLRNNNYRLASFQRLQAMVPLATTDAVLWELVGQHPDIFRNARMKGGRPGLALQEDYEFEDLLPAQPLTTDQVTEAPKVKSDEIEAEIESEYYRNLGSALKAPEGSPAYNTTLCVLVLRNGFVIVGKSACVNSANFNEEIGKRLAREDAVKQMWPLLGFRLADRRMCT
jgi:hypothetical protein